MRPTFYFPCIEVVFQANLSECSLGLKGLYRLDVQLFNPGET